MTLFQIALRSLRFHARAHLGVLLGALVGSTALIGALVVGDSVRESLLERARLRLGAVEFAIDAGDRLFTTGLRNGFDSQTNAPAPGPGPAFVWANRAASAPHTEVLKVQGTAAREDGSARALNVQILGVTPNFWGMSRSQSELAEAAVHPLANRARYEALRSAEHAAQGPEPGRIRLNRALARQLQAHAGETLILRFAKPSALSQDAVLSPHNEASATLRLQVEEIVEATDGGDFALGAGASPALNAFVDVTELWKATSQSNRANLFLSRGGHLRLPSGDWRHRLHYFAMSRPGWLPGPVHRALYQFTSRMVAPPAPTDTNLRALNGALAGAWTLEDAQIAVREIAPRTASSPSATNAVPAMIEVSTPRIFLDRPVVEASTRSSTNPGGMPETIPVVTYLANSLRHADRLVPYSMVTGAGAPYTPSDMADDEIVVNEWLASELGVKRGDPVELTYFDPEAGARLVEKTNSFRVRDIVPLRGWHADRTLMPEFPGLAKAESTSDWDAGFPLRHKLRPQDEAYWKQHRGTPKAFVTAKAGLRMWSNRFGDFTAVRFPVPANQSAEAFRESLANRVRAQLRPDDVGLSFQPVSDQALRAATSGQDFGGLFIGFSFFLVLAALLLMALMFQFGLEQRLTEVGTLLAVGFQPGMVRRLWMGEALMLASIGAAGGIVGGTLYARAMIHGLGTLWRDAVGGAALAYHGTAQTIAIGFLMSVAVCGLAIFITLRRQFLRPARELLAGGLQQTPHTGRGRALWIGVGLIAAALGLTGWTLASGDTANAENFFSAGSLLLIGGLALFAAWLGRQGGSAQGTGVLTAASMAIRGAARRRSRSLATAALIASGTFLVASLGVFRMDAQRGAWERGAGTGGFALVGEASLPVSQDLNTTAGLEFFGLSLQELPGVSFVPFRVRDGDDASCLNLNRAQRPRILGVDPTQLSRRGAFTFAQLAKGLTVTNGWQALRDSSPVPKGLEAGMPEVAAIGDAASIQWALGKKLGDTLDLTDERGKPFRLRLVGAVANSILQGNLVIDEAAFNRLFPGNGGYRWFLIDAPTNALAAVSAQLSRALQDQGLALTPAVARLDQFNAVQNTYLSTFQVLGGLGLLLGSAGLGVVVLRNVLERRPELALLSAVGFRGLQLKSMILLEHAVLLATGLGVGLASAAVAVLPALSPAGGGLPLGSLAWTLGGVVLLGLGTTWAATRASLLAPLLPALRGE